MTWLLALVVSVTLAPPFIEAEASALRTGDVLELQVRVEVDRGALTVLARPVTVDGTELPPTALSSTGGGVWQGIVTVPPRSDIRLGFELIAQAGSSAVVSEVHTLIELGVDPAVFRDDEVVEEGAVPEAPPQRSGDGWGWLALAAGAAALALVTLVVFGRRRPVAQGDAGDADTREPLDAAEER